MNTPHDSISSERRPRGRTLAALLGLLLGGGVTVALTQSGLIAQTEPPKARISVDPSPVPRAPQVQTSFAPVVEAVAPSVVSIYSTKTVTNRMGGMTEDPFLRRFFGGQFGDRRLPREQKQRGLGSGVIVTADGYILSNEHVISGADEIEVILPGSNESHEAKVVGTDPKTDIAVLKVEVQQKLPTITFGSSEGIKVGDVVLAVGNPFGVGQTVTMGIISATRRGGMNIEEYEDFIQTDAAINPGNSGGALVDANGRLIGINTAIVSGTGGFQGVGFAVPVQIARFVMEQVLEHGRVIRGYLGVTVQDVSRELAQQFNLEQAQGALVGQVVPNSPADDAGVQTGDVIVSVAGEPVTDSRNLKLKVGSMSPGTEVPVTVVRDGKERKLTLELVELPTERERMPARGRDEPASTAPWRGLSLEDLTPTIRQQLELPAEVQGAVVTHIDPNSAAYAAGLRPGDIIQEVNRQPVTGADPARAAMRNVQRDSVLLRVWSGGGSRYLVMDLGREE